MDDVFYSLTSVMGQTGGVHSSDIQFLDSVTLVLCILGIVIVCYTVFFRGKNFSNDNVSKWILLISFLILSPLAYIINFTVALERTKPVSFCNSCHVMNGYVEDLKNPDSEHIASLHYQNRWIADHQCYTCHTDYGIQGTIKAKMDGMRHIWAYYIAGYKKPVKYRGTYNNQMCLHCHEPVSYYQEVPEHQENREAIESSKMSCFGLQCHVRPHPKDAWRTTKKDE